MLSIRYILSILTVIILLAGCSKVSLPSMSSIPYLPGNKFSLIQLDNKQISEVIETEKSYETGKMLQVATGEVMLRQKSYFVRTKEELTAVPKRSFLIRNNKYFIKLGEGMRYPVGQKVKRKGKDYHIASGKFLRPS